jgi:hypothetical protein
MSPPASRCEEVLPRGVLWDASSQADLLSSTATKMMIRS